MIVERFTIPIKPGKMDEALIMIKDDNIFASFTRRRRICSPLISPRDVVVVDLILKIWLSMINYGERFLRKKLGISGKQNGIKSEQDKAATISGPLSRYAH